MVNKIILSIGFIFFILIGIYLSLPSSFETLPIAYKGRFRPFLNIIIENKIDKNNVIDDPSFIVLPNKSSKGSWSALNQIKNNKKNFTLYSNRHFEKIKEAYYQKNPSIRFQSITDSLQEAYSTISKKPYLTTANKIFYYPSLNQLYSEAFYLKFPWIEFLLIFYCGAIFFLYFSKNTNSFLNYGLICLIFGFILHTLMLLARIYILERPPVANMLETVLYVPWIILLVGGIFWSLFHEKFLLQAASLGTFLLLLLLKATNLSENLDNVQPVLDSQYWLTIHVLLVVGSYGAFALSSILGHFSLLNHLKPIEYSNRTLTNGILQTLYLGVAMLIPGTLLGGVWAAQSWGRFWDWDPKESWAFISSCIYLIVIHAYQFRKINAFGLAIGSVVGFAAISFTWYGVNYILGTGFHSYGFGNGGELYYYGFLIMEVLFLTTILYKRKKSYFKTL